VRANGNLDAFEFGYSDQSPFFYLELKKLGKPVKAAVKAYFNLMAFMSTLPDKLSPLVQTLNHVTEKVKEFPV
jgi:hypothetical protein